MAPMRLWRWGARGRATTSRGPGGGGGEPGPLLRPMQRSCRLHCAAAAAAGLAIRSRPGAVWLFCIVVPYSAPFSSRHQGFADCMKRGRSLQPICWWQATRTASEPTPADGSRSTVYYSEEVGLLLPVHHNQRSVMAGTQTIILACVGSDRRSEPSRGRDIMTS
jgi:hypothetical protein